jgi:hypothetical protein
MQRSGISFKRAGVIPLLAGALTLGALAVGASALTPPDPNVVIDHVTICHRTNSNNNPYIINTPAADGDVSGHADHTGPVWNDTLKADHIRWGDIIPPFKWSGGTFPGLNWTTEGQAIYAADCGTPPPEEQVFGTLQITKAVVNPNSPDVPTGGFTVHVDCDDKARDDITIPSTGNVGSPVTITDVEAGSTCIVTEVNPPAGVTYTPTGVNVGGVVVDGETTVSVTITNTFPVVQPAAEAIAIAIAPTFTG